MRAWLSPLRIRWYGGAAVILAALLANGCGAESRYRVLSLIFDGVPPPPRAAADSSVTDAGAPGGVPAPAKPQSTYRQHVPYAKRNCGGCHESGTNRLLARPPELCRPCHPTETRKKQFVHAPEVSGFCNLCHNPHGSKYPSLLNAAPREMCFYCHNPSDVFLNPAHKDQEASCIDCHSPHVDTRYFLKTGVQALEPS